MELPTLFGALGQAGMRVYQVFSWLSFSTWTLCVTDEHGPEGLVSRHACLLVMCVHKETGEVRVEGTKAPTLLTFLDHDTFGMYLDTIFFMA